MTVTRMLTVLTMLVASPASVERDTMEVGLIVPVREIIIGLIINAERLFITALVLLQILMSAVRQLADVI